MVMMRFDAVIFDYFGTIAEHDGGGVTLTALLAERGYQLSAELARYYWQDGIDGTEHVEHSRSREQYMAWRRSWLHRLMTECGVPTVEFEAIEAALTEPSARGRMVAYPETATLVASLTSLGVPAAICSNWDWDLRESMAESGLSDGFDVVVSSAWVGARKPHSRIYQHTLDALGVAPERALFVGDTWNCDIEGPQLLGMQALYVRRAEREPDHTAPTDAPAGRPLLDVLELLDAIDA
jgi:HAD superfamily hydrolase (TIGR01509 family)